MHAQIKKVIGTIRAKARAGEVYFDLTAGQQTPIGKLLYNMYYRTNITSTVREHLSGYPHNGGEHTCYWSGPTLDGIAFVELLKEEMEKFNLTEEESQVNSELSYISQELYAFRRQQLHSTV